MAAISIRRLHPVAMLAAALAALPFAGCYSIHVGSGPALAKCRLAADDGEVTAHMLVQNNGWFLFNKFPIVCGNPDESSWCPWAFFRNRTDIEYVQRPVIERARERGERIVQMSAVNSGAMLINLPGVKVSIPYVVCHRETQISAVLVKDAARVSAPPQGEEEERR